MSFNSKMDLDTVLDKTLFQEYRRFVSVYSLSHNIPQTLKIWLGFKKFPLNFCQIKLIWSTYTLLAYLGNPAKAALGFRGTHNALCLMCLTDF